MLAEKRREADASKSLAYGLPQRRVAEENRGELSFHPLVWNDLVVFHDLHRIFVYNLQTGRPAWPQDNTNTRPGQVYPRGSVDERDGGVSFNRGARIVPGLPRPSAALICLCGWVRKLQVGRRPISTKHERRWSFWICINKAS